MVNQTRSPFDDADIDGFLNANYTVAEKSPYNMSETMNLANQKSKSGFVIIGITNKYCSSRMNFSFD